MVRYESIYVVHYTPSAAEKIAKSANAATVPDDGEFQSSGETVRAAEEYALKWFKDRFGIEFTATDIALERR